MSTPAEYFTYVESEEADNLCHWHGELYLELHNGTYTTQAKVSQPYYLSHICNIFSPRLRERLLFM